jgi:hypothetical protein
MGTEPRSSRTLIRDFLVRSPLDEAPVGYRAWIKDRLDLDDELFSSTGISDLSLRCSAKTCIHYIYGFSHLKSLKKHLEESHHQILSTPASISQDSSPPSPKPATISNSLDDLAPEGDFVYVSFDSGSVQKSKAHRQPARCRKRKRRNDNGSDLIKPARQSDPCLRCKILKKEVRPYLFYDCRKADSYSAMTGILAGNVPQKAIRIMQTIGKYLDALEIFTAVF